MERELVAVKILHDDVNRMVYNLYAEFFRFCGVYVGEGILSEYSGKEVEADRESFQLLLCIYKKEEEIQEKFQSYMDDVVWIDAAQYTDIPLDTSDKWELLGKEMVEVMDRLKSQAVHNSVKFPIEDIQVLLPVFVKKNVTRAACMLQYYRMVSDIHIASCRIFEEALMSLPETFGDSKYIDYARIYCKQKINLSCYFQRDRALSYPISNLLDECKEFAIRYPDFSNIHVLAGMICEKSDNFLDMAFIAYKNALEMIGDTEYAHHVYYWLAALYQKFARGHNEAKRLFEKSCSCKRKYRNIYKLGSIYGAESNYPKMIECYEECVAFLEKRLAASMDPLEVEYYYKTVALISIHNVSKLQKYDVGIENGEKALKFYREELEESKSGYFKYFFGEQEDLYRRISRNRINRETLYANLAVAYRETGDLKRSEEYWKKVEDIRKK
jgi:tetratricopeptide (TPR) repeat protein